MFFDTIGYMNDDQLDDLKQFIDSRISQSEARFDDKIEKLRREMHDGFAGVGEAIDEGQTQTDKAANDLERRLANLEHQAAA